MKKISKVLALCLVSFMALTACGKSADKAGKQTAEKKDEMMKGDAVLAEQKKGALVIDVRSDKEYKEGHIKDAKNVSLENIDKEIEKVEPNKDKKIILYCNSGKKSGQATEKLKKLGYKNVVNAQGVKQYKYDLVK